MKANKYRCRTCGYPIEESEVTFRNESTINQDGESVNYYSFVFACSTCNEEMRGVSFGECYSVNQALEEMAKRNESVIATVNTTKSV